MMSYELTALASQPWKYHGESGYTESIEAGLWSSAKFKQSHQSYSSRCFRWPNKPVPMVYRGMLRFVIPFITSVCINESSPQLSRVLSLLDPSKPAHSKSAQRNTPVQIGVELTIIRRLQTSFGLLSSNRTQTFSWRRWHAS